MLVSAIKNNHKIEQLILTHCQIPIEDLLVILADESTDNLNWLDLSGCQFNSSKINQIFRVLKQKQYLKHIDLTLNMMTNDVTKVKEIIAMIKNNKQIQSLSLPNCLLFQKDLGVIIQTLQTVSSLQYVNFNTNKIDDELASDVATLLTKLAKIKLEKLALKDSGFQNIKTYLVKLTGLKHLVITDCIFNSHDVALLEACVCTNYSIQELIVSNCQIIGNKVTLIVRDYVGVFDQLKFLELNNNNFIDIFVCKLSVFLSYSCNLRQIILCNCQLQSNEIKQILMVMKYMRYLECVDLSGNYMADDGVSDMEAMIVNNKRIQKLCLPNYDFSQTNLKIIIQAMQIVSSLQYIDFGNIGIDDELASEVALLIAKNNGIEELKFSKLELRQSGFKHLNDYLTKIKGLSTLNMSRCSCSGQNAGKLVIFFCNNSEIQEINLPNCIMLADMPWSVLSYYVQLKRLNLSKCLLEPNEINQIFKATKHIKSLQYVDLSGNFMKSDAVNDIAAMIKNNKHIQSLSLPHGIMSQEDLRIIIQAMQTVSLLQYIDFNGNEFDISLVNDIAILFSINKILEELKFARFELDQSSFKCLKHYLMVFKGVKYFKVTGCTFTDQDVDNLVTVIINNPGIEELELYHCKAICEIKILDILSQLTSLPSLKCLILNGISITDEVEHELTTLVQSNSNLKHLEMIGCNPSSNFVMTIQNRVNLQFVHDIFFELSSSTRTV